MKVFIGPSFAAACGSNTFGATSGRPGTSQRKNNVAEMAPANCAAMNSGASAGRIPAKVSDNARAMVTAGFAKEVEAVNQYAAVMYPATANGIRLARVFETPQITAINPKVATNSLNTCADPCRACCDKENSGKLNIRCARAAPVTPPATCAQT